MRGGEAGWCAAETKETSEWTRNPGNDFKDSSCAVMRVCGGPRVGVSGRRWSECWNEGRVTMVGRRRRCGTWAGKCTGSTGQSWKETRVACCWKQDVSSLGQIESDPDLADCGTSHHDGENVGPAALVRQHPAAPDRSSKELRPLTGILRTKSKPPAV